MHNFKQPIQRFWSVQVLTLLFVFAISLSPAPKVVLAASIPGEYVFDISEGSITIQPDGSNIEVIYGGGSVSGIPPTNQIKIIGSATLYSVLVDSNVTCKIMLENATIDTKTGGISASPFEISDDSIVTLTLSGTNTLVAEDDYAGLTVRMFGTLIVEGTGSLSAVGGYRAAGIGNVADDDCGKLYFNGGIIEAFGGRGAAGIGSGVNGDVVAITIRDSVFIKNAQGGDAENGVFGGGAGIGIGGVDPLTHLDPSLPMVPGWFIGAGIITISSGVDISRINGGAAAGDWEGGAPIGSGGSEFKESNSYPLHAITFHNNEDPDITQVLTYTINGNYSDAVLPTLGFLRQYNSAFVASAFNGLWYETPLGTTGAYPVGLTWRLPTNNFDLYAYGVNREPKTGL
ncbi:MAG: hypothetical protein FWG40_11825 [Peptococcaceae bacterium]|nr:hypothetical protein [Peptococcaceae bacterium]